MGKRIGSATKGAATSPSRKREAKEALKQKGRKQRLLISLVIIAVVAVSAFAILSRDDPAPTGGSDDGSDDEFVYGPYGRLIDGNPTIMDIGSTSCIPCQQLQPVLTSLGQKYDGEINFQFYDCWNTAEGAEMATAYQVAVIPTLIFLDGNGHEVARLMGYNSQEDIEANMSELGWI